MAEETTSWKDPITGEVVEWDGNKYVTIIQPYKNLPRQAISDETKEAISSILQKTPAATGSAINTINAPFEFFGNQIGELAGEPMRNAAYEAGLGPTGSAVVGTAFGAPVNAAIQLLGPGQMVKKAVGGIKMGMQLLPGSQAARIEIGIDKLKAATNALRPTRSSSSIYEEVARSPNPIMPSPISPSSEYPFLLQGRLAPTKGVPTPELSKTLDKIIAIEEPLSAGAKDESILNAARSLKSKIEANNGTIDLHEFGRELSGIGENVKALQTQGKRVHGGFAQLFKTAANDLGKTPGGKLLREAAETYRKEQAINELDDIVDSTILLKRGSGTKDINANRVIKQVDNKPFLEESFNSGELGEIKDLLQKLVEMPALPAPRGAAFGAGLFGATSGVIAGPAMVLGVDPAVASGLGVSFAAVMEVSRRLLPSPTGRKLLKSVLESGPIDVNKLNRLNALARGLSEINLPLSFTDAKNTKEIKRQLSEVIKDDTEKLSEKIHTATEVDRLKKIQDDLKNYPKPILRGLDTGA